MDQSSLSKSFGFVTLVHRIGKISNQTSLVVEMVAAYPEKEKPCVAIFSVHLFYVILCCHCHYQLCCDLFISPRGCHLYCFPPRNVSILYQLDVWWLSGHMCGPLWSRSRLSAALRDLSYSPELLISDPGRADLVQDEAERFWTEKLFSPIFFFFLYTSGYMSRDTGSSISYVTATKHLAVTLN